MPDKDSIIPLCPERLEPPRDEPSNDLGLIADCVIATSEYDSREGQVTSENERCQ